MTELTDDAVKVMPNEIQVWRNTDTLDHIGTWATTRYPEEAVTYVPKADAQAAVARGMERAAGILDVRADVALVDMGASAETVDALGAAADAIRAAAAATRKEDG